MGTRATTGGDSDGYVEFVSSGQRAKGDYHCSECGYGVTVFSVLPPCPMCGGASWEQWAWSPFARAPERALKPS